MRLRMESKLSSFLYAKLLNKHLYIDLWIYLSPIILSLISMSYLLKPGYSGFMDNGGLALDINEYIKLALSPWGFWFGPSLLLQELVYLVVPSKTLAWKISIFMYQYLTFICSYLGFTKMYKTFIRNVTDDAIKITLYLLALGYAFNIYVVGGLWNFYLPQFQNSYTFGILYISYFITSIFYLIKNEKPKILNIIKNFIITIILGILSSTAPNFLVMSTLVIISILLLIMLINNISTLRKIGVLFYTALLITMSAMYYIIDILLIYKDNSSITSYINYKGIEVYGWNVLNILTFSYNSGTINTIFGILYIHQLVIPSALPYYLPYAINYYLSIVLLARSRIREVKIISLGIMISELINAIFLSGTVGNSTLNELYRLGIEYGILPKFILPTFLDQLPNLEFFFLISYINIFLFYSLLINKELLKTKINNHYLIREKQLAIICILIVISPIIFNFISIQYNIYAKLINPAEIPSYYGELFNFIRNHEDHYYLWIPFYGILSWRESFMSNIPGYLSEYYGVKPLYINNITIVYQLSQGTVPVNEFKKYNIGYIVVIENFTEINQYMWQNAIQTIRSNPEYFKLIFTAGNVCVYEVNI